MKPDETLPVFVYLATNRKGIFKIGISNNPYRRDLKIDGLFSRGDEIEMLRVTFGGRALEKLIHERFCHLRIPIHKKREWFRDDLEIVRFFDTLPDADYTASLVLELHTLKLRIKRSMVGI